MSLSEGFALRGAASTGFRAPTPGQQNAFTSRPSMILPSRTLPTTVRSPRHRRSPNSTVESPWSREKSVNLSFGSVFQRGSFSLSADYFLIDVSQRLTTSRNISLTNDEIQRLVQDGIIRPGGVLKRFQFFVNDFLDPDAGARRRGRLRCRERPGRHHREHSLERHPHERDRAQPGDAQRQSCERAGRRGCRQREGA